MVYLIYIIRLKTLRKFQPLIKRVLNGNESSGGSSNVFESLKKVREVLKTRLRGQKKFRSLIKLV